MVEVTYGNRRPSAVVAIRRVEALTEWSGPFIGAGVTYARMEDGVASSDVVYGWGKCR